MKASIAIVAALALSAHPEERADETRSEADGPLVVQDTAREPDVVIVTAEPPEPGEIPTFEFMQQTYDSRGKGACLYRRGRYEEAFPYLRAAARKGFKLAQARLGFLYQQGLGTDRDPYAAVGWYSVAALGTTLPEIRNYFNDVWRRIPEEHQPSFAAVVKEYRAKYGARQHRIDCDFSHRVGTFFKQLTCRFRDEAIYIDFGPLVQSMVDGSFQNPGDPIHGNPRAASIPLRSGGAGC